MGHLQAEAIDTPFSTPSEVTPKSRRGSEEATAPALSRSERDIAPEKGYKNLKVASTGSGGFDAYIDQEARQSQDADDAHEGEIKTRA